MNVCSNVYVRAFGGTLPAARWERSAEKGWVEKHGIRSEADWAAMIKRAAAVLKRPNTKILRFSHLSEDLEAHLNTMGQTSCGPIQKIRDSTKITNRTKGFRPIEIEAYAPNKTLLDLTKRDLELMKLLGIPT